MIFFKCGSSGSGLVWYTGVAVLNLRASPAEPAKAGEATLSNLLRKKINDKANV